MSKKIKWGFSTKSIHAGNEPDNEHGSVSPPIHLTSTFKQDAVGKNRGHDYSRVSNPTRSRLEENLSSTSSTSVFCKLRISTANLSMDEAKIPKTEKK